MHRLFFWALQCLLLPYPPQRGLLKSDRNVRCCSKHLCQDNILDKTHLLMARILHWSIFSKKETKSLFLNKIKLDKRLLSDISYSRRLCASILSLLLKVVLLSTERKKSIRWAGKYCAQSVELDVLVHHVEKWLCRSFEAVLELLFQLQHSSHRDKQISRANSFLPCKHRGKQAEKPLPTPGINTKPCSRGGSAVQQAPAFSFTLLKYFCCLLCTVVSIVQILLLWYTSQTGFWEGNTASCSYWN